MKLLRPGGWEPTGTPALLAISLVSALTSALRGLDYWRPDTAPAPGVLALVESAVPARLWAVAIMGSALLILLGIGGRWAPAAVFGHLGIAAAYVGIGFPVLAHAYVGPASTLLLALTAGALGTWTVVSRRAPGGLPARLLAVVMLAGVAAALSQVLGTDYRTGSGLVGTGLIHCAVATGIALAAVRAAARATVECEEVTGR